MAEQSQNPPLVFIDDAHTFGGTQIALAWTLRIVLSKTNLSILCICPHRTRAAIEAVTGRHARLRFERAPAALPLNLFTFPLRLPAYWSLLRRIRRAGVRGWWLNQPDIEFCLAPLLVLRALGETTHTYLHGTGRFTFFYRAASFPRRCLSRLRDAVADRCVFRLHHCIVAPSRASQQEVAARISSRRQPRLDWLYPPNPYPGEEQTALLRHPASPADKAVTLELWMIGNVVQGHKNQLAGLDVLEYLVHAGRSASLTIAGSGPDLQRLLAAATRRKLADRIICLGWVQDPCALVPPHAIVFIPSFHETMSLVARDAMHYGLRLVASPITVFHEWIPASLIAEDFSAAAFAACVLAVNNKSAEELEKLYRPALAQFSNDRFLENLLRLTGA